VLIVCHTVVVPLLPLPAREADREKNPRIDREHNVANCSITSYARESMNAGKWTPELFNFVAPMREAGEKVTTEPDVPVTSR
jgi:hypothetical protein